MAVKNVLWKIKITLTHAILERRHDLHVLPGYPQLVGIDVVGGAALLALVTVRLHGRAAILSVKGHTDYRREIRLSRAERKQDAKQVQNIFSHALVYQYQSYEQKFNKNFIRRATPSQTINEKFPILWNCEGEAILSWLLKTKITIVLKCSKVPTSILARTD